ncbi:hypothetical protein LIER_29382 [Lithospermum erythrorhizon]|uniref:Uncharacterized protein n=1 Tax=Lithospermum erythrorhizon TaxID=34254 RepID=A0AAV3RMB0_LITER
MILCIAVTIGFRDTKHMRNASDPECGKDTWIDQTGRFLLRTKCEICYHFVVCIVGVGLILRVRSVITLLCALLVLALYFGISAVFISYWFIPASRRIEHMRIKGWFSCGDMRDRWFDD